MNSPPSRTAFLLLETWTLVSLETAPVLETVLAQWWLDQVLHSNINIRMDLLLLFINLIYNQVFSQVNICLIQILDIWILIFVRSLSFGYLYLIFYFTICNIRVWKWQAEHCISNFYWHLEYLNIYVLLKPNLELIHATTIWM